MMGKTSLLMFPIYGLAALIRPAYYKLARFPVMVRGIIYSCGIFFRGIFKRIFFSEASHLSLGLFSCSASV